MNLTALIAHRVSIPLRRPFTTAVRSATGLETVLVEVRDSDGRSGWGEAPISVVTKTSTSAVIAAAEGPLWSLLAGSADISHAIGLVETSSAPSAGRAAVDCALHDLGAQQAGVPLEVYLAGQAPDGGPAPEGAVRQGRVLTDMTLSVAAPGALAERALAHAAEGFGCLKVKLDAAHDPLAAMLAVRAAVGPAVTLRIDANQAFTPEEAIAMIRAFEENQLGIELVEQPVAAGDWEGLARVSAAVCTPVMADESVWTAADLETLLTFKAAPLVNIKLAKTGGLRPAQRMVARAHRAGLGVVVGCMLESQVGIGAAAALAATLPSGVAVAGGAQDLDGGLWLASSPIRGGAHYQGAEIILPDTPGQGIEGLM
ncbi:MAG: dipeptide epimerase [Specibacter sp.]